MNAIAPGGAPLRRINNLEHFGKHGTTPLYLEEALRRGALISVIFMVRVWTLRSYPFLQSMLLFNRSVSQKGETWRNIR